MSNENIFRGCIPAVMTPCDAGGSPNYDVLVSKGLELVDIGMRAVVYCGSMGDWPLLSDAPSDSQQGYAKAQWDLFKQWWANWSGATD